MTISKHRMEEMASIMKIANAADLTSLNQFRVFVEVARHDEPITAKLVSERIGISKSQASAIFRTLEDRGMATVFIAACKNTKRNGLVIDLTGKGRVVAAKMGIN